MPTKTIRILAATLALGAAISFGSGAALARGHGGHGHSGGHGHIGRAAGAHVRGLSGAHGLRSAHIRASRSHLAHVKGAHVHGKHAWNRWGNRYWWHRRWAGPVYWPYFYGDLLAFVLWPYGYYDSYWFDPFWAYGDDFVWDAIFWPGSYAYTPEDSGGYGDNEYSDSRRRRAAREAGREIGRSTSNGVDLAQTCSGLAPGITDLPIDRIEKSLRLTDEQFKGLDALKAASSQAGDALKSSCSSEASLTPLGRLDTVQKRLGGMIQALGIMRTPLDNFYNSLDEEQRERFAELGPSTERGRRASASANDIAALCSPRTETFTQLPVQRIEQVIKPTQEQQGAFDTLKAASTEAAKQLQASCPTKTPEGPIDRFDAVAKRLDAVSAAIKTIRPALAGFYASLTDEQKARFNVLGPPESTASRQR